LTPLLSVAYCTMLDWCPVKRGIKPQRALDGPLVPAERPRRQPGTHDHEDHPVPRQFKQE
jgi:hypothetical protein